MFEENDSPFDASTEALLPEYLAHIPNPVQLRVWADASATLGEREAVRLVNSLAEKFDHIESAIFPRRTNYPYYPVIGVFSIDEDYVDYGIRLIGLPAGLHITSLIAAIQAVTFRGATLEAKTRILLSQLDEAVTIELISSAEDEFGTRMSRSIFGMAAASRLVRAYLIMGDVFPEVLWRYSVDHVPHLVVNGRTHVDGELNEESIMRYIALALGR